MAVMNKLTNMASSQKVIKIELLIVVFITYIKLFSNEIVEVLRRYTCSFSIPPA